MKQGMWGAGGADTSRTMEWGLADRARGEDSQCHARGTWPRDGHSSNLVGREIASWRRTRGHHAVHEGLAGAPIGAELAMTHCPPCLTMVLR